MARVAGVDLAPNKRIDIALRRLYGIGPANAVELLQKAGVPAHIRVKALTQDQLSSINDVVAREYKVEGELRREVEANIRRYIDIGSYKGQRHRRNLPVRGQRTRTNARTRRGAKKTVGSARPGEAKAPAAASTAGGPKSAGK